VASLRRIGVPLAQVTVVLVLEPDATAERVGAHWAGAESEHTARRELVGVLVDRLHGKRSVTYEVSVPGSRESPVRRRSVTEPFIRPKLGSGRGADFCVPGSTAAGDPASPGRNDP
jgi:hypothetical protein